MSNTLFEPEENYKSGWIKIFRSIRTHWIWNDPVKLKWWIDILLEVNHSGKTIAVGYKIFECNRGECIISLQNWGKRWNVSKTVVNNFFRMLENDNMIKTVNETVTTRLTVCNYDTYQADQNANKTQTKRKQNATVLKQSTTKNDKELKNKEKEDIYSKFYDSEIIKSNNDFKYISFIKYIFGENDLKRELKGLLSITDQLTYEQFLKLKIKAELNKVVLMDIVEKIENDKKYWKGKTSLYRTMNNWIENRFVK